MTELWSGFGGVIVGFALSVALTFVTRISDNKQKLASYMVNWVGVVRSSQLAKNADRLDIMCEQLHLLGEQICVWGRGRVDVSQVMCDTITVVQQIHFQRHDESTKPPPMPYEAAAKYASIKASNGASRDEIIKQMILNMYQRINDVLGSDWLSQAEVEL